MLLLLPHWIVNLRRQLLLVLILLLLLWVPDNLHRLLQSEPLVVIVCVPAVPDAQIKVREGRATAAVEGVDSPAVD